MMGMGGTIGPMMFIGGARSAMRSIGGGKDPGSISFP